MSLDAFSEFLFQDVHDFVAAAPNFHRNNDHETKLAEDYRKVKIEQQ